MTTITKDDTMRELGAKARVALDRSSTLLDYLVAGYNGEDRDARDMALGVIVQRCTRDHDYAQHLFARLSITGYVTSLAAPGTYYADLNADLAALTLITMFCMTGEGLEFTEAESRKALVDASTVWPEYSLIGLFMGVVAFMDTNAAAQITRDSVAEWL